MTVYDLTHPLEPGMPVYPGDPPVSLGAHATHEEDGYRVSALSLGTHAGTHVDAPSHTEPAGADLDAFAVERFRFEALRVDCRSVGDRAAITVGDLPEDPPDPVALLALWTGFDAHWDTDRYRDHPHLAPGAAEWCADHGLAVGIDAFSPDPTPPASDPTAGADSDEPADGDEGASEEGGVPAHHALLGAGLPIVENLRNLGAPPERFVLAAYPLRVDADGAPVRAVAVVE